MTTRNTEIEARAVETDEELRLVNDLMAKLHYPDYFEGLQWLETCGGRYPDFLREHTRVALRNGQVAGALRINTETVRIGEARLRMGGFGWVSTAPRHRKQGVARTLICDALEYMRQHHYHVSMLFGIPNFYHRFGFATTLPEYDIVVSAAEAMVPSKGAFRLRTAKPGDIRAIQRIHAANDSAVACSLVRTAAHITNKWESLSKGLRVLTTEQGKVVAYLKTNRVRDELLVSDLGVVEEASRSFVAAGLGGAKPELCPSVLAACGELAASEAVGHIRFQMPPPHPFARYLLRHTSRHEMHVVRDCGGMMAFVDVAEALECMIPEWESLLSRSAARELHAEFTFLVDRTPYRIRAHRGAVDVAAATGKNKVSLDTFDLVHLVTGYRHVEDVLSQRRRVLSSESRVLLSALFPKRHPYVWHLDRF